MPSQNPIARPTDDEGLALSAFISGRWNATRSAYLDGHWSAAIEGRSLPQIPHSYHDQVAEMPTAWLPDAEGAPEPVKMAGALNRLDWLDAEGKLTELGRMAHSRWLAYRSRDPGGRWVRDTSGWYIVNNEESYEDVSIAREESGWRFQTCRVGDDMTAYSDWEWDGAGCLLTDADIVGLADHIRAAAAR